MEPPLETDDPAGMDDRQNVLNIAASGCNLSSKAITSEHFQSLMDFCKDKIGLLLSNNWITGEIDRNLNSFLSFVFPPDSSKKAFVGFQLVDEPKPDDLSATNEATNNKNYMRHSYCELAKTIQKKRKEYPTWNPLIHVNLLPIHGFHTYKEYQAYLDKYQCVYDPAYYSFDQYPVAQLNPLRSKPVFLNQYSNLRAGSYIQFHERFYRTLQMISDQSRKYGKPFWSYPLTSEHTLAGGGYYPAQKEQFLRYQVFTALAYGAQGLCYWRFLQNHDDNNNLVLSSEDGNWMTESYYRHPIREDRRRTPYWYYVRRINNEIKKYEDIFLTAELRGVYHTHTDRLIQLAADHNIKDGTACGPCDTVGKDRWGLTPLKSDSISVIRDITSPNGGLGVLVSNLSGPKLNLSSMKITNVDTRDNQCE